MVADMPASFRKRLPGVVALKRLSSFLSFATGYLCVVGRGSVSQQKTASKHSMTLESAICDPFTGWRKWQSPDRLNYVPSYHFVAGFCSQAIEWRAVT